MIIIICFCSNNKIEIKIFKWVICDGNGAGQYLKIHYLFINCLDLSRFIYMFIIRMAIIFIKLMHIHSLIGLNVGIGSGPWMGAAVGVWEAVSPTIFTCR